MSLRSRPLASRCLALAVPALAVLALAPAVGARPAQAPPAQAVTCTWKDLGNLNRNVAYSASAMDTANGVMYTYGGYGDDSTNFQTESAVSGITFGATFTKGDTKVAAVAVSGSQERDTAVGVYRPAGDDSAIYWIAGRNNTGETSDEVQVYHIKKKEWKKLATTGNFSKHGEHGAEYDPKHDVIWVAAGEVNSCTSVPCTAPVMPTSYLAFDPTTGAASWHDGPSGGPKAKGGTMVYDSQGERMLFFGGTQDGDKGLNQLFQLDLKDPDVTKAKWSTLATTGTAPSVAVHTAGYHPELNWMIVYGGMKSAYAQANKETGESRTYALDLSVTPPAWRNLNATIGERIQSVMEYVPQHKGMVLTSGRVPWVDPPTGLNKRSIHGLSCAAAAVPTPKPTQPSGGADDAKVCDRLRGKVPAAAIDEALANPSAVGGWNDRCMPNLPPGMGNGPRRYLGLANEAAPYHPMFNGLVWRCGCR